MRAEIDPNGFATTYLFEYTTEAKFRTQGFIGATKVPQTGVSIGNGLVAQRLDALTPDTAYRFRVIANSNGGTLTDLKTRSFRTDQLEPVFALPDDRGWEMVSPFDKNGGDIQGAGANHGGGVLQAAAQGGALTYTSASSFAGPLGSPGPNQYLSTRGPESWSTENLSLPMLSGTYPESRDQRRSLPALLLRPAGSPGLKRPPLPHLGRRPSARLKTRRCPAPARRRATATTTCAPARAPTKRSSPSPPTASTPPISNSPSPAPPPTSPTSSSRAARR